MCKSVRWPTYQRIEWLSVQTRAHVQAQPQTSPASPVAPAFESSLMHAATSTFPRLNEPAPDFPVKTTHGDRTLSDYKDKWPILFSHPADFTPVCTTELKDGRGRRQARQRGLQDDRLVLLDQVAVSARLVGACRLRRAVRRRRTEEPPE